MGHVTASLHPSSGSPRARLRRGTVPLMSVLAVFAGLLGIVAPAAQAAVTFTVTSTADPGDGDCSTNGCTLAEAITAANSTTGADRIEFNLAGSPPYTIQPMSNLPIVTDSVVIDGTQPGFSGTPVVELDGSNLAAGGTGLQISAANSTVRGLTVNRFPYAGILLSGTSADGNLVEGNFIGTDTTGGQAAGNGVGVRIDLGSQNNTIGGTTASARNVISGNTNDGVYILGTSSANATSGNVVQGNYIGTDVTGSTSLGNSSGVHIEDSDNNTVGGTSSGAGNVLSGNGAGGQFGLVIEGPSASGNVAQGNYIGVKASGTGPLANGRGVLIQSSPDNTIGGTTAQARNVISGNTSDGLTIVNSTATGNSVQGNSIGADAAGNSLGNGGQGVLIYGAASNNTVGGTVAGAGNTIAYNGKDGISVGNDLGPTNPAGTGNSLLRNSIFSNGELGIDLVPSGGVTPNDDGDADAGSNSLQNFPVLTSANSGGGTVTIQGTLNSTSQRLFRLEFYSEPSCDASGNGEGRDFLGSSQKGTDVNGNDNFSSTFLFGGSGGVVTATATDMTTNDTSEFAACVPVTPSSGNPPNPPTGVSAGAGDGQAEVSWIPPNSNGGSPITAYTVDSSPPSGQTPKTVGSSTTSTTIGGLNNGTSYTFTVTATNGNGSSAPSAPSISVIPRQGAAPPESRSEELPAGGGTLSTGSSAGPGDPTNTTVVTPNGGDVTIGESVMSGTPPPGVTYFGQQVDITAPAATANNPLMLTFVTDCSVLPLGLSSCPGGRSVVVTDRGYTPPTVTVRQSETVQWLFQGPHRHSVTDSRGLGPAGSPLFNSGSKPAGTTYSRTFPAAGGYPYHSTVSGDPLTMTGTVQVPVEVSQSSGNPQTTILITWASSRPTGYRFDVQYRYKRIGSSSYGSWVNWQTNTQLRAGQLIGEYLRGSGNYQFRARLENSSTLATSLWSLPSTVTVSSANRQLLDSVAMFRQEDQGVNAQVPDCIGPFGAVEPTPSCTWSEEILPDGDLKVVIFTTSASRWRTGIL